jgi:hypothetical protein
MEPEVRWGQAGANVDVHRGKGLHYGNGLTHVAAPMRAFVLERPNENVETLGLVAPKKIEE